MIDVTTEVKWNGKDVQIKGTKAVKKSLLEYGIIIEAQAVTICPANESRLRGSITTQTKDNEHKNKFFGITESGDIIDKPSEDNVALVGTDVKYAPYVEFGTKPHFPPVDALKSWAKRVLGDEGLAFVIARSISKKGTKAHPFMRPAIDITKPKGLNVFIKNVRAELADYFKEKV